MNTWGSYYCVANGGAGMLLTLLAAGICRENMPVVKTVLI